MDCIGHYYTVADTLRGAPLREHLLHGYEYEDDFRNALRTIVSRWRERTGECMEERNGFLHLRFHDTPGGRPDEAWLPAYLLREVAAPSCGDGSDGTDDELERELDEAFGFD